MRLLRKILLWALFGFATLTVLPVVALRWLPAPGSAFMLEKRIGDAFDGKAHPVFAYRWVDWERISPQAKLAVIAAEDQKFPEHMGFDMEAIEKALEHNEHARRKRGASTISQQLAKNLFLWPSRSWIRKGSEVYFTLLIETLWPKQRILEMYLNVAEFGENVYGVEAAAQRYWGKSAAQITAPEAALLAAVLPNPRRLRAAAPSLFVQTRANWIEEQMNQLGLDYLQNL